MSKNIDKPLISILMAAYNSEKYIEEAIQSVINQTYKNWELIICDDCSLDNTFTICESYHVKDSRIKVIKNNDNMGQAQARNNAFLVSTGEYITILDSDDTIDKHKLEKQLYFLLNNKCDLVGSNATMFNEKDGVYGYIKKTYMPNPFDIICNNGYVYASIMCTRNSFQKAGMYTVSPITQTGEDFDLICKMYELDYIGYNLQEFLYNYRVSRENYNRRKYICYYHEFQVAFSFVKRGWFNLFSIQKWKIIYIFSPLIKGLIPKKIMKIYHKKRMKIK